MSKTDAFWQLCLSADLTDEVRWPRPLISQIITSQ